MPPRSPAASAYLAQAPEFVDTGSARLAYRRFGQGEPLLLVHGWPFSGFVYRKILPQLARHFTCYAVDLAGAGDSSWTPDNDFSFHGHAENLRRLVDALGLGSYRIIAHDTGATVARRLAIIDAQRAGDLVLIDTEIPHHRPPLVEPVMKLLSLPGSALVFRTLLRSRTFLRLKMGFGACFHDPDLIDAEFCEGFVDPLVRSAHRMEGQIRYVLGIDWSQLDALAVGHGQIPGRVLLVWGTGDPFFPIDRARQMIPQFRQCVGLEAIAGARLLPHEEKPDEVLGHVQRFFGVTA